MTTPQTDSAGRPEVGPVIRDWWAGALADRQTGAARALSARVRRNTPIEVLAEPQVQELHNRLYEATGIGRDADRLLRLVRVLAELRGSSNVTLAKAIGNSRRENGKFKESETHSRFQKLMRAEGDELTTALIRAIRSLGPVDGRSCAIAALGRDLWFWTDSARARWTFDYFGAPIPGSLDDAPQTDTEETPS